MLTREEFLIRRKSGIGGSDVGAIMGLSKFRTAFDVWHDKITDEINLEPNDILDLSSYLEE
jgi:predicted phage-related endonuclease